MASFRAISFRNDSLANKGLTMSLLQDIQNAAVDAGVPISTLLRKCAMLAARLDNDELRGWVTKELNGYDNSDEVPDYRVIGAPATGHLAGPFGSGYQNITIPAMVLPDWARKYGEEVRFTQPIAAIEELGKGDGVISCPWPGDLIAYMQTPEGNKFAGGLVLYGAWQSIARANVFGIVDTVRNRVLEFALRLEKEAPAAGEPDKPNSAVADATVTHLYQTIIHGDVVGNVATGSNAVQSTGPITVAKGDIETLRRRLADFGVPQDEIANLEAAIAQDPPASAIGEKRRTIAWLGGLAGKVFSGAVKLSRGVSVDLIAQVIGQFLGIDEIPTL
jgi:hypothetical protein